MSFSSWNDYYPSKDIWFEDNTAVMDVINLLASPTADLCITNLVEHDKLVAMSLDPLTEEIIIFHHLKLHINGKKSDPHSGLVSLFIVN